MNKYGAYILHGDQGVGVAGHIFDPRHPGVLEGVWLMTCGRRMIVEECRWFFKRPNPDIPPTFWDPVVGPPPCSVGLVVRGYLLQNPKRLLHA